MTRLKTMSDSLASIIPFSLGRIYINKAEAQDSLPFLRLKVDEEVQPTLALPAIWPLAMASGLDGVEPSQKLWFSSELVRLGRVLGDGALECAGTEQWTHE